jgi:hypothetical protein
MEPQYQELSKSLDKGTKLCMLDLDLRYIQRPSTEICMKKYARWVC